MVGCPATVVVDGKTFKNYDDYPFSSLGKVTLREAFAQSCNTAFIKERDKLGTDAPAEAAAALGLGIYHDLALPAYFGQVHPPSGQSETHANPIPQAQCPAHSLP